MLDVFGVLGFGIVMVVQEFAIQGETFGACSRGWARDVANGGAVVVGCELGNVVVKRGSVV